MKQSQLPENNDNFDVSTDEFSQQVEFALLVSSRQQVATSCEQLVTTLLILLDLLQSCSMQQVRYTHDIITVLLQHRVVSFATFCYIKAVIRLVGTTLQ